MTRLLAIFLLTVICSMPALGEPQIVIPTEKKYPPYPEVWGYDFSDDPFYRGKIKNGIEAYKMPDGDIWLTFLTGVKQNYPLDQTHDKKYNITLMQFFSQKKYQFSSEYYEETIRPLLSQYDINTFQKRVETKDFAIERKYEGFRGNKCKDITLLAYLTVKKKINEHVLGTYAVYGAYPHILRINSSGYDKDLCPKMLNFTYLQLYNLGNRLIPLEDNTFLTFGFESSNLIVRFDQNLDSKFSSQQKLYVHGEDPIKQNFFVLPYQMVKDMYAEITKWGLPEEQGLQEAILGHFYKKQKSILAQE